MQQVYKGRLSGSARKPEKNKNNNNNQAHSSQSQKAHIDKGAVLLTCYAAIQHKFCTVYLFPIGRDLLLYEGDQRELAPFGGLYTGYWGGHI